MNVKGLTYIDLFCGIGGFSLALDNLGAKCAWACDIDEDARWAYKQNFPDHGVLGDIKKIKKYPRYQPESHLIPGADIVVGGLPCQAFSQCGMRGGFDDKKTGGDLFFEVLSLINRLDQRPKVVVLENVKGILSIDGGKTIEHIENCFRRIGYYVDVFVLNSGNYGLAQWRDRVFIVATDVESGLARREPKRDTNFKMVKDILERDGDDIAMPEEYIMRDKNFVYIEGKYAQRQRKMSENPDLFGGAVLPRPILLGKRSRVVDGKVEARQHAIFRIYSIEGMSPTLMKRSSRRRGGIFMMPDGRCRWLTDVERRRLMGFPEDWVISPGTTGFGQLGNAVCAPVVEALFSTGIYEI